MNIFADKSAFDPSRDSKIPVRRGPIWLVLRALTAIVSLGISKHPGDAWTWLKSMILRRRPLSMGMPWLTFDAIRHIERNLPTNANVFEFGSGNSTLFWLSKGATVFSVENDIHWHDLVSAELTRRNLRSCRLIHATDLDAYVGAIYSCPERSQDLILIDGAYRRDCVAAAIPYVRPGGMLVVDNTDWHWFHENPIEGIPNDWPFTRYPGYCPMLGHKSETSIWTRPKEQPSN